ncbi:MAG: ABC-F family ATP-binding cassette domain-containing protein [Myxococcota bacterium]
MLTTTNLGMQFGGQTLFTAADLQFRKGQRYGIVGANGSGKSTLLRILSGEQDPSEGDLVRQKRIRIGVLEQDHFQYEDVRILDVVMMGNPELYAAMSEKEALLEEPDFDVDRYGELEDLIQRYNGYELEARAGKVLEGLGIPSSVHDQPLRALSGGFKLRALLARTLAAEPDLLFLDEPTNHLDILAIQWLEEFLVLFAGCAICVSHDQRFLNATCTHILDVDYERVTAYKGNYNSFLSRKKEERQRREAEIEKRQQEIDDHKAFVARFAAKATKARQANSRQKRLSKITIEKLPTSSRRFPGFSFSARRPSGREVLKLRHLRKAFHVEGIGERIVLDDVSVAVERGDRLAVIGPNGVGKSTLLKIAMGHLQADEGEVNWGYETDVGYFPQDHADALGDPRQSVLASLWEAAPDLGMGEVMARLGAVLFSREDAEKSVENLSGGEAARLLFARIAVQRPTVMVLDEPTNHLDLEAIAALARALKAYDGTLIFVSHDRWFVDRLATRILELGPHGVVDYPGTYAEYLAHQGTDHLDHDAVVTTARQERRRAKRNRRRGS